MKKEKKEEDKIQSITIENIKGISPNHFRNKDICSAYSLKKLITIDAPNAPKKIVPHTSLSPEVGLYTTPLFLCVT